MTNFPRISFGIIVLNGEPFTRYNLRALYPFAYQIIVAEGAGPWARHMAGPDGHSVDGTLEILRRFQKEEDPEGKVTVITAEDEGYPNGFWPGEKDEQSQAYAKRATGDWLWQVDIDEFYHPADIHRVCEFLQQQSDLTCLTFNLYHFWGGFDYVLEGGLLMSRFFAGEPWGAIRRVFKWGAGYRYLTHRPPTVVNAEGQNLVKLKKRNLSRRLHQPPIFMFHYSYVFPSQVIPKGQYFANHGQEVEIAQRYHYENFLKPLDAKKAVKIFDHWGTFNWLRRFNGSHPPAIRALRHDLELGDLAQKLRPVEDIEEVLASPKYCRMVRHLYYIEKGRSHWWHLVGCMRQYAKRAAWYLPSVLMPVIPRPLREKILRIKNYSV